MCRVCVCVFARSRVSVTDITFGIASRESAGLTTASPGVLYKIDGIFKNGTTKGKILPRFNLDTRKPLADNIKSTTSAVYWPQLSRKVYHFTACDEINQRAPGHTTSPSCKYFPS